MTVRVLLILASVILSFCKQKEGKSIQQLHDIWMLEEIENEPVSVGPGEQPRLEIFVAEKQALGFGGCNNFSGGIDTLSEEKLVFGLMMSTKMYCEETAELESAFLMALSGVKAWEVEKGRLRLFNGKGDELLELGKTD